MFGRAGILRIPHRRPCVLRVPLAGASSSSAARDPHTVLGVVKGATASELKRAYRDKALAHHPDRHSAEERDASEAAFKEISQAYARLAGGSDPTIRDELTKEVTLLPA